MTEAYIVAAARSDFCIMVPFVYCTVCFSFSIVWYIAIPYGSMSKIGENTREVSYNWIRIWMTKYLSFLMIINCHHGRMILFFVLALDTVCDFHHRPRLSFPVKRLVDHHSWIGNKSLCGPVFGTGKAKLDR